MALIPPSSSVVRHLYKNRLQTYAQKRNLTLPEYSIEREGPTHASRFKSKVSIDRKTYESLGFFPSIKEAEHALAEVAWKSLFVSEVQNLLQELAQKEGIGVCMKQPQFLSQLWRLEENIFEDKKQRASRLR